MHPEALITVDTHDDFNPPPLVDYAEMSFAHPEHFLKESTRDVVPTQSEYMWEFLVKSNQTGSAQLNWDNTRFGTNSKELFLYDIQTGKLIDMRDGNKYSFDPKKSSSFRLYFGEDLKSKIKPQHILLGDAYPNPGRGEITIPFTLPDDQLQYKVSLEVFDVMGRKIATLVDGVLTPGFYSYPWQTEQVNLRNGLYLYRMKVAGKTKTEILSGKITLNH